MKKFLTVLFIVAFAILAQNPATSTFPSAVATDADLTVQKNRTAAYLTAAVTTTGQTSFTVDSTASIAEGQVLGIDSEYIQVTTVVNSTTLTVTRGVDGSATATHNVNARLYGPVVSLGHNRVAAHVKAIENALGTNLSKVTSRQTGTAAPSNPCATAGTLFTDTTNQAQYFCPVDGGTWKSVGAGSALFQASIKDLLPTITSNTLTIAGGRCWGVTKAQATAVITAGSGNGSYVVYCTPNQVIIFEHSASASLTVSCTNCSQISVTTPAVPEGYYKIASGNIASGAFSSVIDDRDFMTGHIHQNGLGMDTRCVGNTCEDKVDPASVQMKSDAYNVVSVPFDTSLAATTKPMKTGTAVPGSCTAGEFFYKTDASPGSRIYECNSGSFTVFSGGGSGSALTWPSDNWYWPYGIPSSHTSAGPGLAPGPTEEWTFKFTPVATITASKLVGISWSTGYIALAVSNVGGTAALTNATCRFQATSGASFQCSFAGNVTMTAGTTYKLVVTSDNTSTGLLMFSSVFGDIVYTFRGSWADHIQTCTTAATGTGATLAVTFPLTSCVTPASIKALPAIAFVP